MRMPVPGASAGVGIVSAAQLTVADDRTTMMRTVTSKGAVA
jgi:hypothetical protein